MYLYEHRRFFISSPPSVTIEFFSNSFFAVSIFARVWSLLLLAHNSLFISSVWLVAEKMQERVKN
jgi:hypothetical protein